MTLVITLLQLAVIAVEMVAILGVLACLPALLTFVATKAFHFLFTEGEMPSPVLSALVLIGLACGVGTAIAYKEVHVVDALVLFVFGLAILSQGAGIAIAIWRCDDGWRGRVLALVLPITSMLIWTQMTVTW